MANYAANLPNSADRAGTFQPLTSFWERLFGARKSPPTLPKDIVFPDDDDGDVKLGPHHQLTDPPPSGKHLLNFDLDFDRGASPMPGPFEKTPAFLRKNRSSSRGFSGRGERKAREAVRFNPGREGLGLDDLSEDDDDDFKSPLTPREGRPWVVLRNSTEGGRTLVDEGVGKDGAGDSGVWEKEQERESDRIRRMKLVRDEEGGVPEYSDYEEDVTNSRREREGDRWSPGFLRRHRSARGNETDSTKTESDRTAVASEGRGVRVPVTPLGGGPGSSPMAAVPATPSLIRALDRIAVAQQVAFGARPAEDVVAARGEVVVRPGLPPSKSSEAGSADGLPKVRRKDVEGGEGYKGPRWDEFWNDVREVAGQGQGLGHARG